MLKKIKLQNPKCRNLDGTIRKLKQLIELQNAKSTFYFVFVCSEYIFLIPIAMRCSNL